MQFLNRVAPYKHQNAIIKSADEHTFRTAFFIPAFDRINGLKI